MALNEQRQLSFEKTERSQVQMENEVKSTVYGLIGFYIRIDVVDALSKTTF